MTPDRWREVSRIYGAVLTKPESDRATALTSLCANDAELRAEVESLLQSGTDAALIDRAATERPSTLGLIDGRAVGTQIGVFRIDSLLGVGGMGEVYRARDTKLNRDVAIKILPPAFASDPERLARFKREAQVLASLNHPNIGAIHGFEDSGGLHALVLELVEGPTLADKLARGSGLRAHGLPLDEALAIARQICEALEAAHEQGIIHRDLKPANIKVRDDGTVKVLDFGLAKMAEGVSPPSPSPSVTQSPTITTPAMTTAGMILGTAAYMSPEQAKGKPADKRSDIWAFGCVLYEMLTGKRAFEAADVVETLAEVIKGEPRWSSLPDGTPSSVRRLLRRCLAKNGRRRIGDIATARLELDEPETVPEPAAQRRGLTWPYVSLAMAAIVVSAAVAWRWQSSDASSRAAAPTVVEISTMPTERPESIALSPDGRSIVFAGERAGEPMLWLRPLNVENARPLPGTEAGEWPFWSPDGTRLGFFSRGRLRILDLGTGGVRIIATAERGWGGAWNSSDTILFVQDARTIVRASAGAGAVAPVPLKLDSVSGGYRAPRFLPDGRHFIFLAVGVAGADPRVAFVGDVEGGTAVRITPTDEAPSYANGRLYFVREGVLLSQPFDATTLALSGTPTAVSNTLIVTGPTNIPALSASPDGTLAFRGGQQRGKRQLLWVDRSGRVISTLGDVDAAAPLNPTATPDGSRIALNRTEEGNTDLWAVDPVRGTRNRLTTDAAIDQYPLWSPDGSKIVYSGIHANDRTPDSGGFNLYLLDIVQPSVSRVLPLRVGPGAKVATDWSRDGEHLLFRFLNVAFGYDIWTVPVDRPGEARALVATAADERDAQFSPDGKWIAYQSDQSGRDEIYALPFPAGGTTIGPISVGGGTQVRWRSDGSELFYLSPDRQLMAVPVREVAGTLEAGAPQALFTARVPTEPRRQQYLVSTNGDRFLLNARVEEDRGYPITLMLPGHP